MNCAFFPTYNLIHAPPDVSVGCLHFENRGRGDDDDDNDDGCVVRVRKRVGMTRCTVIKMPLFPLSDDDDAGDGKPQHVGFHNCVSKRED